MLCKDYKILHTMPPVYVDLVSTVFELFFLKNNYLAGANGICVYGFVCYTNQIRATINANTEPIKSQTLKLMSHVSKFLRAVRQQPF